MPAYSLTVPSVWLVISGFLCLVLSLAALGQKQSGFSGVFACAIASIALYSLGYALELGACDLEAMKWALRIEYLGIPFITSLWVIVVLRYAQLPFGRWGWGILLVPCLTFLLAQSNELHHWFYADLAHERQAGLSIALIKPGPWYYVHNAYSYACFVAYSLILLRAVLHAQPIFRTQALLMLCAGVVPLVCLTFYLSGLSPRGVDLSPFGLAVTGVVSSLAVWRYEFLTLAPMARDVVFNSVEEVVLVLDDAGLLIDFNHAARRVFSGLGPASIGSPISSLIDLPALENRGSGGYGRLQILRDGASRDYEVRQYALRGGARRRHGQVLLLQDVTERLALEQKLFELAIHDELTGLHNRHYLMDQADKAVQAARRYEREISVLIGDMDGFKQVNDRQGHLAGDKLLQDVGNCLRRRLRQTDIIGRYGGDEFVIVLPETGAGDARRIADELGCYVAEETGNRISIGAASLSADKLDFLSLLHGADSDLYRVKQARSRLAGAPDGIQTAP